MLPIQILINQLSFKLSNGQPLFNELSLSFVKGRYGLVGKNGIGKSTLFKLIINELKPNSGSIDITGKVAYVPQSHSVLPEISVANFLGVEEKINALHRIIKGSIDENDYIILNEQWTIEEDLLNQLKSFGLNNIAYNRPLQMLSGGEITRLALIKAFNSQADFILLDEPTNHLDLIARAQLYKEIEKWQGGLIIISHDRILLNIMDNIIELNSLGANNYGGNYDFYEHKKEIEHNASQKKLQDAKKYLDKVNRSIQLTKEKHEQRQASGKRLRRSGSQAKIILDAMKNRSTKSLGEFSTRSERMREEAEEKLKNAKENIEISTEINIDLPKTYVPQGKVIVDLEDVSFAYLNEKIPIINHFNLKLVGPKRIALKGMNGSGKTTLIKLILKELIPQSGNIYLGTPYINYLDQSLNQLEPKMSILDNFMRLNPDINVEEAYQCLAYFAFRNISALKLVKNLSGGERLRVLLACVLMSSHPPQLLILDEPTNHLDLDSIKAVESALLKYQGALIVVSHDEKFLEHIQVVENYFAPYK